MTGLVPSDARPVNVGQLLSFRAVRHPDRLALVEVSRDRRFSYTELNQRANRIGSALADAGVRPGDRVALLMLNGVELVESFFGLAKHGVVVVPLNHRLAAEELRFILDDAGAVAVLYDHEFDRTVAALRDRVASVHTWVRVGGPDDGEVASYETLLDAGRPSEPPMGGCNDDPLFIMYTSGTTGRPKGAVHTHASIAWGSLTVIATCDIRDHDRELVILPLFHIGALLPLTWTLHRGGAGIVLRSFDPVLALRAIERERVTTGLVVPTILASLLEDPSFATTDYRSLRWVIVGGAPVPPLLARRAADAGILTLQDYGSTEAAVVTITDPDDAVAHPDSAGRPVVHSDVRIVDPAGRTLPNDSLGEILVRGRQVMAGYWNRPDATAAALRDGWFHTGDLGSMDAAGRLRVCDRKVDLIISGGENIYPAEVERVLGQHPDIHEVAVVGQASAKWGESAVAVIVPVAGSSIGIDELVAYCREHLAGYKIPRHLVILDRLPRTAATGKVQKHLLRSQLTGILP